MNYKEIKVDRILPEHLGMAVKTLNGGLFEKIVYVGHDAFVWENRFRGLCTSPNAGEWILRAPEPPKQRPSERIAEILLEKESKYYKPSDAIVKYLDEQFESENK